ncbi:MAG: hypothetical protein ABUS79_01415 [Pseudomonadota bacterium]
MWGVCGTCGLFSTSPALAQTVPPPAGVSATPCGCAELPPTRAHVIEVTFGSAQLFSEQGILTTGGQTTERVIPVSSALMMIEWLFRERLSVLSFFNLPLGTQKTVVNGQAVEEFVAPSVPLGLRASLIRLEVFAASRLEFQVAAMGGVTIGSTSGDVLFPMIASRIHFASQNGFALYLGTAFAFQKDTLALLYGIGHRF